MKHRLFVSAPYYGYSLNQPPHASFGHYWYDNGFWDIYYYGTGLAWWGLLVFIPILFVGAQIAKRIVHRIPQTKFRLLIACFLFLLGLKIIIWPH